MELQPSPPRLKNALSNSIEVEWDRFAPNGAIYVLSVGTSVSNIQKCYEGPNTSHQQFNLQPLTRYCFTIYAKHNNKQTTNSGLVYFSTLNASVDPNFFQSFQQQMQQQIMNNPETMRTIMNDPVMQNMMTSPEIMESMLDYNPQLREIINRNPEMAHVLSDPKTMQQCMRAIANPSLLREMLRNNDRLMSNVENLPGGFNALRRAYNDVQDPLMDALTNQTFLGTGNSSSQSRTVQSYESKLSTPPPNSRPESRPFPNPWKNNSCCN